VACSKELPATSWFQCLATLLPGPANSTHLTTMLIGCENQPGWFLLTTVSIPVWFPMRKFYACAIALRPKRWYLPMVYLRSTLASLATVFRLRSCLPFPYFDETEITSKFHKLQPAFCLSLATGATILRFRIFPLARCCSETIATRTITSGCNLLSWWITPSSSFKLRAYTLWARFVRSDHLRFHQWLLLNFEVHQ